jgi:hypothetical protein
MFQSYPTYLPTYTLLLLFFLLLDKDTLLIRTPSDKQRNAVAECESLEKV